jgi:hypothetical protein
MANPLKQLADGLANVPGRILRATGWWQHLETPGLGAGPVHTSDLDELEAERRREREVLRQGVDESDPSPPPR